MPKIAMVVALLVMLVTPVRAEAVIASWYSMGHTTANGEPYNPDGLTCAHKTLPFGTRVRVTYRGRSVICRINDRGPFIHGRSIDLSRGTARAIGMLNAGVARVDIQVIR